MVRVLKHSLEILKQFLLFFFIFTISLIIFSIISATLENAHGAQYDYIKIPELVFVNSSDIYLKDIAEIHIDDKEKLEYVSKIILGNAPIPGKWRFFKGAYIQNFLKSKLQESVKIIVPSKIKVISKVRFISGDEIMVELKKFLEKTDVWKSRLEEGNKLILNENIKVESISVPDREMNYFFSFQPGDDLLGLTNIEFKIFDEKMLFKKMWIRPNIAFSGQIIVAKRDLRLGEIIDESMIETREISIENSPSKFFTNTKDVVGKRVKGFVRMGFAIMEALIENPPLVNYGDMVKILAENDFVYLTAEGISLARGVLGSVIRIKNLKTNKIILAKVVGEKEVRVNF